MSHQGHEGWIPECIVCHCGDVGPVVCLDPTCRETYGLKPIHVKATGLVHGDSTVDERLIQEEGHWWNVVSYVTDGFTLIREPLGLMQSALNVSINTLDKASILHLHRGLPEI